MVAPGDRVRMVRVRSLGGVAGLRGAIFAFLLVASVSVAAAPVAAQEDPRFEASVPEPDLAPGTQTTLTLSITNDAADVDDRATTASNVRVTARSGSTPIEVLSGEQLVGQLEDGASATVSVRVEVPADAPGGSYDLPLDVVYEYDGDERERTTINAAVDVPERPIFAIATERVDLFRSETGAVTLSVSNVGSRTATATRASVTAPGSEFSIGEGAGTIAHLGTLAPGETDEVTLPVAASGSATATDLRVEPTYENDNGLTVTAPARSVGVTAATGPRFDIVATNGQVSPGETGTVEWTMENRGEATAENVVVTLEATDAAVTFGDETTTTRFVDSWEPGESVTVETPITASPGARDGQYPLTATVAFDHAAGFPATAGPYDLGIPVSAVGTVSFDELILSHGGPQAVLTGVVRNDGDEPLENAVVDLVARTEGVTVRDGRTAVGSLDPGETAPVSATVLTGTSDPMPLRFDGQVSYERDGADARSQPTSIRVDRAEEDAIFAVEGVNATLSIDAANELHVRVENLHDEELTDVRASLTVDPPYESQSPTAYVGTLGPGESAVVAFQVTTPEDGIATRDAVQVNVSGETVTDRTLRDGPHTVPIEVGGGEAGGGSIAIAVLAIVVIALLGGGWWWLNR